MIGASPGYSTDENRSSACPVLFESTSFNQRFFAIRLTMFMLFERHRHSLRNLLNISRF